MRKIIKYSFYDLMRSRWSYVYFLFYLLLGFMLLFLNTDLSKAVITLMNIITVLTPLIGTVFGTMYYYNSREFTTLLLAQPLRRSTIFVGQFIGVAGSLSLSLVLGLGIPFAAYGLFSSDAIWQFTTLLSAAAFLTFIFVALAFSISLANENKIKGFGYAILVWLLMAVVYDGLFMLTLDYFNDYPIHNLALALSALNPIDLSRIMIILQLDISALLTFTGAVFQQFFGTGWGKLASYGLLTLWVALPVWRIVIQARRKDF